MAISAVHAAPSLAVRQNLPDPAGAKNLGNGVGGQFIGGQCLGAIDCASGCCAIFPKGGSTIGICSGVGAQAQAGKQGCGFETGNAGNDQIRPEPNQNGDSTDVGAGAGAGTVKPSTLHVDPAGAANVGNRQGKQFIGGQCTDDTDCASTCCALVNTGAQVFGICSGPGANTQNGKQGCGFPNGGQRNAPNA